MKNWKKSALCSAAAGALLAGGLMGPAVAAPNPPEPVSGEFEEPFVCESGVRLDVEFSGKAKTIDNPGGVKSISPGFKATVTNADTGESARYTITGTVRSETLANGFISYRATGRNLIIRPDPAGLFVTSGNVTFTNNAAGGEEVPFSGPGNVIDLCRELA